MFSRHSVEGPARLIHAAKPVQGGILRRWLLSEEGLFSEGSVCLYPLARGWT